MSGSLLPFEQSLAEYFRLQLEKASERLDPPVQEDTLWYVGNMLARFGDSKQLFGYDREYGLRPLALLFKDAQEARGNRERSLIMRQLGDMALFIGALFPHNFAKRGIFKDYFIGMGGGAYAYLSAHASHNQHIYCELADSFTRMLRIVAYACSREHIYSPSDLLAMYEQWRKTRDPMLRKQLAELGVSIPDGTGLQ